MQKSHVPFSGIVSYDGKRRKRGRGGEEEEGEGRRRSRGRVEWTRVQWFQLQILISSVLGCFPGVLPGTLLPPLSFEGAQWQEWPFLVKSLG